jgi:hypothetical protein
LKNQGRAEQTFWKIKVEQSRANVLKNQGRAEQTFLNQNFKSRADPKLTKLYFEIAFIGRFSIWELQGDAQNCPKFCFKTTSWRSLEANFFPPWGCAVLILTFNWDTAGSGESIENFLKFQNMNFFEVFLEIGYKKISKNKFFAGVSANFKKWKKLSNADKGRYYILILMLSKNEPKIGRRPIKEDIIFWIEFC